ncbi:hypothetical protein [Anaerophilus nitritogenes]|uniref:hypothetical protein n=1 Tax=Anaerophilus nitritogenes TaxID=2498136 RepID=UPI001FAA01A4|nr:hypothetical protein [Anaerophilus nitritogenes]
MKYTGERIIPKLMNPKNGLLIEHTARYEFALLSWIRLHESFKKNRNNIKELQSDLDKLVQYLLTQHIKELEIIYKSSDYYTLQFLKEGQTCIKQFKTEEVELHI